MQVINIYGKEFHQKILFLSFNMLITSVFLMFFILMAILFYGEGNITNYEESVRQIEKIKIEKEIKLQDLKNIVSVENKSVDVLADLKDKINKQNIYKVMLNKKNKDLDYSYRKLLVHIANNINSNLYIEERIFSKGVNDIKIKGKSKNTQSVAKYLYSLKVLGDFDKSKFTLKNISKNESGFYSFYLGGKDD